MVLDAVNKFKWKSKEPFDMLIKFSQEEGVRKVVDFPISWVVRFKFNHEKRKSYLIAKGVSHTAILANIATKIRDA